MTELSFIYRAGEANTMRHGVIATLFIALTLDELFSKNSDPFMSITGAAIALIFLGYIGHYFILRHHSHLWLDDKGIHYHHPVFKRYSWHIPYSAIHNAELGIDRKELSQTLILQHHEDKTTIQLDEWHLSNQPVDLIPALEHPIYLELRRRGVITDV